MNSQNWRNVNEKTNLDPMSMVMDIESGKIDQAQLMDQIIAHCKASYEEGFKDGQGGQAEISSKNVGDDGANDTGNVIQITPKAMMIKSCKCRSFPKQKQDDLGYWSAKCEAPMCIAGNPTTTFHREKIGAITDWNNDITLPTC